jgi:hypothetical protein
MIFIRSGYDTNHLAAESYKINLLEVVYKYISICIIVITIKEYGKDKRRLALHRSPKKANFYYIFATKEILPRMNNLSAIIDQYKSDRESVFNTWFINNEERLKAFRSIRRGVMQVIDDIKCKHFPNDFKGSTVKLIDVLWFQKGTSNVIAAFEVEKSTSIYSGILRLTDLSYTIADGDEVFYLIVPDNREKDVRLQLSRPAIKQNNVTIKYILFSELRTHCDALCKFGDSHMIMEKIAKIA